MASTTTKKLKTAAPPGIDLAGDAHKAKAAKPEDLKQILDLAKEMYKLELSINTLDKDLKAKKARYNELMMTTLPERMELCGLQAFTLGNGYEVCVKDFITAKVPTESQIEEAEGVDREALQAKRDKALAWLRKNNADSLIKNYLSAEFGKGQDKDAKKFHALIKKAGFAATCEESVNYQTLNAFIREQLAKGVEVPSEPFSLFIGKVAKITQQKKKQ